jgi:uncharacterized membrane protein YgaE (UPF0421/DUF939 family)
MEQDMKIKIGMRNVKTAVSVFICVFIFKILHLGNPFYAAIAAIITMQNSPGNTFKAGRSRMMGTFVGEVTGLIFASIQPENAVLCGLGIIVVIYVCNLLKWNSSISIAGVVFVAIMVNMNGKSPLSYSTYRLIDTLVGIGVAFAVNSFIFPYDTAVKIYSNFTLLTEKVLLIINQVICKEEKADLDSLQKDIWNLNNQVNSYVSELKNRKAQNQKIDNVKSKLRLYDRIFQHLNVIQNMGSGISLNEVNIKRLEALNYGCSMKNEYSDNELDIVYNYHIARVIDALQCINNGE